MDLSQRPEKRSEVDVSLKLILWHRSSTSVANTWYPDLGLNPFNKMRIKAPMYKIFQKRSTSHRFRVKERIEKRSTSRSILLIIGWALVFASASLGGSDKWACCRPQVDLEGRKFYFFISADLAEKRRVKLRWSLHNYRFLNWRINRTR